MRVYVGRRGSTPSASGDPLSNVDSALKRSFTECLRSARATRATRREFSFTVMHRPDHRME